MSELKEYKCPCCGGGIEWNAKAQKMKCPYCDTEFEPETLLQYDKDLSKLEDDDLTFENEANAGWSEEEQNKMNLYVCQSCGGEVIADNTTSASSCPYCGNPVIMKGNLSGDLKPDYVIPFKYDKKAAKAGYQKHLSGKFLLPKVFKDENHIDEIKGVYIPFWLFDSDVSGNVIFDATKEIVHHREEEDIIETKHYNVIRGGSVSFDNVPVDGSTKMDDALMESIEPFEFKEAVPFQTAYLSGFLADRYDVDSEASKKRARERIIESTISEFKDTVTGFDSVTTKDTSLKFSKGNVKYALYPAWILNTTWQGKKFTFAMNGQTGKFVGDLPTDKTKFGGLFGVTFVAITIIMYILLKLMGM